MRLLSRHALALDDEARVSLRSQSTNDRICFGSVARPVNLGAATLRVAHKLFEIPVEMQKYLVFDRAGLAAQIFPVRQARGSLFAPLSKKRRGVLQRAAQMHIRERRLCILLKCLTAEMIHLTTLPDASHAPLIRFAKACLQSASG